MNFITSIICRIFRDPEFTNQAAVVHFDGGIDKHR